MSIDTNSELQSAMSFSSIGLDVLPPGGDAIDQGDQQHLLGLYSGVTGVARLTWPTYIGVPTPPAIATFDVMTYADPSYTYDYGSGAEAYRTNAIGEPYTHYVDPDHP